MKTLFIALMASVSTLAFAQEVIEVKTAHYSVDVEHKIEDKKLHAALVFTNVVENLEVKIEKICIKKERITSTDWNGIGDPHAEKNQETTITEKYVKSAKLVQYFELKNNDLNKITLLPILIERSCNQITIFITSDKAFLDVATLNLN